MVKLILDTIVFVSNGVIPMFTPCRLARDKKLLPGEVQHKHVPEKEGVLSRYKYKAVYFVFADLFFVKTPGQLPYGFGRGLHNIRFRGGTIFNDTATGIIWVEKQISLLVGDIPQYFDIFLMYSLLSTSDLQCPIV